MKRVFFTILIIILVLGNMPITMAKSIMPVQDTTKEQTKLEKNIIESKSETQTNTIYKNEESIDKKAEDAIAKMSVAPYTTINYDVSLGPAGSFESMVYEDNNYDYYISQSASSSRQYFQIIKHDIVNNQNETVYTSEDKCDCVAYFAKGDILYFEYVPDCVFAQSVIYDKVNVLKYNTKTKETTKFGPFNVNVDSLDYYPSFAVDGKERFYFVSDHDDFYVYDNKTNLVSKLAPDNGDTKYQIIINGISPNGKVLLYSVNKTINTLYRNFTYKGMQQLNDGMFTEPNKYTVKSRNPFDSSSFTEDPKWQFLDKEGNYALNQYGQIAKFDYNSDNGIGTDYQVVLDLERTLGDSIYSGPTNAPYTKIGDYYYIAGNANIIFLVDSNFNKVKKLDLGFGTNTLYVRYENKIYVVTNAESKAEDFETITISNHGTQKHTR